jgi:hypothetical protein
MRIHQLGPRTDVLDPEGKGRFGRSDDAARGFRELERPFIDDGPAAGHRLEAGSRWGVQPTRSRERELEHGVGTMGFWQLARARLKNALRGRD